MAAVLNTITETVYTGRAPTTFALGQYAGEFVSFKNTGNYVHFEARFNLANGDKKSFLCGYAIQPFTTFKVQRDGEWVDETRPCSLFPPGDLPDGMFEILMDADGEFWIKYNHPKFGLHAANFCEMANC